MNTIIQKRNILVTVLTLLSSVLFAQNISEIEQAIDAEQYLKAKVLSAKLIAAKPGEAEAYFHLGTIYMKLEHPDSAAVVFTKGITADSNNPFNYIGLGAVSLSMLNIPDAQAKFEKALSLSKKKDTSPYWYIANAYINSPKPDFRAAIQNLEKAIVMDEKDGKLYRAMGEAYHGLKKDNEAFEVLKKANAMDPSSLRSKLVLGKLLASSTAFEEAEAEFKKVIALNPNYAPAYRELAESNYAWANFYPKLYKEKIASALEYYKKYIDLTDKSVESRMRYADFLILARDYKTLQEEATALSKISGINLRVYRYLGYANFENGDYEASATALKSFISQADSSRILASDYAYLGKAQLKTNDISSAISNFEKSIALESSGIEGLSDIAKTLYLAKNYTDAARIYELALMNPALKTIAYDSFYLGMSYYFDFAAKSNAAKDSLSNKLSQADSVVLIQADSAFSTVIGLSPGSPDAYLYRARIKKLMDDAANPKGNMVPDYEKFIELVTAKPDYTADLRNKSTLIEAYSYLGAFSAQTKDKQKAILYFNEILKLDPANVYAKSSLELLK